MDSYFDTDRYTLVPYEYHSTGKEREVLSSLFDLGDEDVKAVDVPFYSAALLYACPEGGVDSMPASFHLLEILQRIPEPHRVLVRFSEGLVTVALADREHLLLLCSYKVSSLKDSLYYVFAALKEVMFEPDHTSFYWNGTLSDEDQVLVSRYFEKLVEINF